ncbi:cysteine dioxygenase family protein [Luedemannella helvata]|uniref:Cysteine dioxygenase n=1 Tax=Luedemannella helvata TaxID=349315 RepID=A0ABP4W376_9ACTN
MITTRTRLADLARRYAAGPLDLRFDAGRRWYARLGAGPDHEAWVLTWLPGQETDLHDHGGSAGAFLVVTGVLTESLVSRGALADTPMSAGTVREFGAHHVHRVANRGTVPAVSVHVYAPALTAMTRYRLAGGELLVESMAQAGVDW